MRVRCVLAARRAHPAWDHTARPRWDCTGVRVVLRGRAAAAARDARRTARGSARARRRRTGHHFCRAPPRRWARRGALTRRSTCGTSPRDRPPQLRRPPGDDVVCSRHRAPSANEGHAPFSAAPSGYRSLR
jgi:hypothetical protein